MTTAQMARTTMHPRPGARRGDLDLLLEEISPGLAIFSTETGGDGSPLTGTDHPSATLALAAAVQSRYSATPASS
jgi:hypothetical protein